MSHLAFGAVPPLICPAGAPIGSVDLRVRSTRGGDPLPLRTINRLEEGDTILYRPIHRSNEHRKGEVAIVLVPADRHPKSDDELQVLDPKSAEKPQDWKVPMRAGLAAFVYGPAGLSRSKVKNFLTKDNELVAQLADYAEKTAQTEALIQALSSQNTSAESVNAAFKGFASQYGFSARIDRTQTPEQQMLTMFQALNPAIASYDPISPQYSERITQTAGLATSVAALFFGSPVGLAAGGTAMLMEMRSLVFPNTVFRSSFAQSLPEDGLGLCGRRDAVPAHTKVAYLWATRVPNVGPPTVTMSKVVSAPVGLKTPIPVSVPADVDWRFLDRARNWVLESNGKTYRAKVNKLADPPAIELDATKSDAPPGVYHLAAFWDWQRFNIGGDVHIVPLSDFQTAQVESSSQNRLTERTGKVPITLRGSDFEFVTKVEFAKVGDAFFTPEKIPFVLPKGLREGEQNTMEAQIDTSDLASGDYHLRISQLDGKPHEVPVKILPPPPTIENLPIYVHSGQTEVAATLQGKRLDLLGKMDGPGVQIIAEPVSADASKRPIHLKLDHPLPAGETLNLRAWVENRTEPLELQNALRITGPLPRITDSRFSLPPSVHVALNPGELPSAFFVSAMLHVENVEPSASLRLRCGDSDPAITLRLGQRTNVGSLGQLGPDQLFVTFDDGQFVNGCPLTATIENGNKEGESSPYSLGRVVRVPKIETLQVKSEPASGGALSVTVTGQDLETIEQFGWDPDHGVAVSELPTPIPGEGQKQLLKSVLPAPAAGAAAPLYVWLRGETSGRALEFKRTENQIGSENGPSGY
jgi:hypothetical protein